MGRATIAVVLALPLAAACSFVNGPGKHMGHPAPDRDGGTAMDTGGPGDSGSDDAAMPDGGPPPPIPAADLCTELVADYCRMRIACCTSAMGDDFDDCRANFNMPCVNTLGTAARDGRTGYDPDIAGQVLAELRSYASTCDLDLVDFLVDKAGFLRMFEGTFPPGTGCGALSLEYYACADGRVCRGVPFFWTCQPVVGADEMCRDDHDCIDRYYCDETRDAGAGVGLCTPRLADLEPCARATQCASLVCDGTSCQPRTADLFCTDPFMDR